MKRLVLFLLFTTYALVACGSKLDANEKNFGSAISKKLETNGALCIGIASAFGGVMITDKQKAALEKAGLIFGSKIELTEIGKKYFRKGSAGKFAGQIATAGDAFADSNFCYGNVKLDKVVKWDIPAHSPGGKYSTVTFSYQPENLADWAKMPEIQDAFPVVRRMVEAKEKYRFSMKQTSEGWEVIL